MKDWITMVDRSCWDQSFVDVDSTAGKQRYFGDDVIQLDRDRPFADAVRRGCATTLSWAADDPDAVVERLNGCSPPPPPTILCSSPSSGPDSGRASTSDDRVYQNGLLAVDGQSSSSSSELSPDLIVLDSGAFSVSSSGSSDAPARCSSQSDSETATSRSWVTTTAAGAAYSRVATFLPAWDVDRLEAAYRCLDACGFYYGRMSMDEATERLSRRPVGTFLLRDSSDRRYLFSLSVQTCRGTTSIRMSYRSGLFRLDCSSEQEHLMPTFDCPLRLVAHYVRLCSGSSPSSPAGAGPRLHRHSYVLLESSGRRDTPVLLIQPYHEQPLSLSHVCRRAIQAALCRGGCGDSGRDAAVDRLQLQPSLKSYLKQYPYNL